MNADAEVAAAEVPSVNGYTLVLPPGWTRIPLRSGTDATIAAILDRASAGRSRDELATLRRELQVRLRALTAAARENNGLDLYLPIDQVHGFTVGASFVVAEVEFGSVDPLDPALVVARLASSGDASAIVVDGVAGSRTESIAPPDSVRDAPFGSRRVDYELPVPGDGDQWVLVSFSTVGQGDPRDDLADLLVELFDAIMTTFRWTTRSPS